VREGYTAVVAQPTCRGCHELVDQPHFAFENYDAVGAYRTVDNGLPIDASGLLMGTDVDGAFKNGVELSARLAGSATLASCLTQRRFEATLGRGIVEADRPRVEAVAKVLTGSGGHIGQMLSAFVATDSFTQRPLAGLAPSVQTMNAVVPAALEGPAAALAAKMVLDLMGVELQQLLQAFAPGEDRQMLERHFAALRQIEMNLR
jgi:hypothetical protein